MQVGLYEYIFCTLFHRFSVNPVRKDCKTWLILQHHSLVIWRIVMRTLNLWSFEVSNPSLIHTRYNFCWQTNQQKLIFNDSLWFEIVSLHETFTILKTILTSADLVTKIYENKSEFELDLFYFLFSNEVI